MEKICKLLKNHFQICTRFQDLVIASIIIIITVQREAVFKIITYFGIYLLLLLFLFFLSCKIITKDINEKKGKWKYIILTFCIALAIFFLIFYNEYPYRYLTGTHLTKVSVVEIEDGAFSKALENKLRKELKIEYHYIFKITYIKNKADEIKQAEKKSDIIIKVKILKRTPEKEIYEICIAPTEKSIEYPGGIFKVGWKIPEIIVTEVRIAAIFLYVYHLSIENKYEKAFKQLELAEIKAKDLSPKEAEIKAGDLPLEAKRKIINLISVYIWRGKLKYNRFYIKNFKKAKKNRIKYYNLADQYINYLNRIDNGYHSHKLEVYYWLAKLKEDKTFCNKFIKCYENIDEDQKLKETWKDEYDEIQKIN